MWGKMWGKNSCTPNNHTCAAKTQTRNGHNALFPVLRNLSLGEEKLVHKWRLEFKAGRMTSCPGFPTSQ
jgi:hypothetical protein